MTRTTDNMFKALITSGWANKSAGDVEASTGHFAVIDMSTERDMMRDVLIECGFAEELGEFESIARSWFGVIEDSNGLVFPVELSDEHAAKFWFDKLEREYDVWADDNE